MLDGALSLAVPTKFGQSLEVQPINEAKIIWESFDEKGAIWFEDAFSFDAVASGFSSSNNDISKRIVQILNVAKTLNPSFLNSETGLKITTHLTFPKNWGLGTSSTLINNVAHWASVDAFKLLEKTFGGSGYDIACAQYNHAITYQLKSADKGERTIKKVGFNPKFKEQLYFVYLNKKQNSREGIANYKAKKINTAAIISEINAITNQMIDCISLETFEDLLTQHESIISKIIKQEPVKKRLFNDFSGSIKSLGAWGGDFVLATCRENPSTYFKSKGFDMVVPYEEMVLNG